jgi:D-beta-D-heptose 7-phosphate kinase/D-beta-D-heptose 1-phosphate adenosyltransferase
MNENKGFSERSLTAVSAEEFLALAKPLREGGGRVVFTNGCFDLLHPGHVAYLQAARALGDALVLGLNSDASVKRLEKGTERPILTEEERAAILLGLRSVDYVIVFDEDTPLELIEKIVPDILVKGGDWPLDQIVGRDVVEAAGGEARTIPFVEGKSTTSIVERILTRLGGK